MALIVEFVNGGVELVGRGLAGRQRQLGVLLPFDRVGDVSGARQQRAEPTDLIAGDEGADRQVADFGSHRAELLFEFGDPDVRLLDIGLDLGQFVLGAELIFFELADLGIESIDLVLDLIDLFGELAARLRARGSSGSTKERNDGHERDRAPSTQSPTRSHDCESLAIMTIRLRGDQRPIHPGRSARPQRGHCTIPTRWSPAASM